MNKITQAVAWWCYVPGKLSPETFVHAAADIGYTAIDLAPTEFWSLIKSHGLSLSAINGHASLTVGFNRRDQHARIAQEIRSNLVLAEQWGIPNLICFSGNREELTDAEGLEATAEGLARLAPAAEASGVTLVLELLNSKVDHPDYQADHTAWGLKVVQQVGSPRVRLLYDIYHMQIMEGDLIRNIRLAAPWMSHIHTAGNPGRNDLDQAQEIYYPAVFRAIAETGYTGYVVHEFVPKGDPIKAMQEAFDLAAVSL